MQAAAREKPPVGIVLDFDLGDSIDDALALALLYGFATKSGPEARLVSISLTKSNLHAAAFCEAVDRYYSNLANREMPERFRRYRDRAIGLSDSGWSSEDTPSLTVPLAKRDGDGKLVYEHHVDRMIDTADPAAVIRNALTAQHDQNAIVVLTGPATNLARVLELRGAKELIAAKVRYLSVMGGSYSGGSDEAEYNVKSDITSAQKLFAEWPTPIVASGAEIGAELLYPGASIEHDFGWTEHHPLVDAYRAHQEMPYDAPTWDMTSALYAVRPDEGYFRLSEPGTIRVLDDGLTEFTPSADGKHRHLILEPAQKECVVEAYVDIVSAMPAPRELPRFLRRLLEQRKKEEEEKRLKEEQTAAPSTGG